MDEDKNEGDMGILYITNDDKEQLTKKTAEDFHDGEEVMKIPSLVNESRRVQVVEV